MKIRDFFDQIYKNHSDEYPTIIHEIIDTYDTEKIQDTTNSRSKVSILLYSNEFTTFFNPSRYWPEEKRNSILQRLKILSDKLNQSCKYKEYYSVMLILKYLEFNNESLTEDVINYLNWANKL